jgi:transposase
MIRSGTINTIHELATQGKSIREIARILGIARDTVRRYLRGKPEAVPRPKRGSKLDVFICILPPSTLRQRNIPAR